jgi:CRISPR-associated protein Csb2
MAVGQKEAIAAPALFGPARVWRSETPFVATRHAKKNGRRRDPPELLGPENRHEFAGKVLTEELDRLRTRRSELGPALTIEPLNPEHRLSVRNLRPIQFRRFRMKRSDDGGRRAAGAFRIVFSEPVRGPLCLGHSSHFGLGLFAPDKKRP